MFYAAFAFCAIEYKQDTHPMWKYLKKPLPKAYRRPERKYNVNTAQAIGMERQVAMKRVATK